MNNQNIKSFAKLMAVLFVFSILGACTRQGTGCPNNFKTDKISTQKIK